MRPYPNFKYHIIITFILRKCHMSICVYMGSMWKIVIDGRTPQNFGAIVCARTWHAVMARTIASIPLATRSWKKEGFLLKETLQNVLTNFTIYYLTNLKVHLTKNFISTAVLRWNYFIIWLARRVGMTKNIDSRLKYVNVIRLAFSFHAQWQEQQK